MLRTLRQPRYAALSVIMLIVAIICVAAGTWQIARFDQKVRENDALRHNAGFPAVPVSRVLPLLGRPAASTYAVEFREVHASGAYDAEQQTLVRNRTVGGVPGYLVLTPLHTAGGVLLVVRGFTPNPHVVPAPPAGTVTVTARAEPPESKADEYSSLANGQVESINPADQATRLGGPTFDGFAQLLPDQPGTAGLRALGAPNLSNPAGGALEPQHFAYIIQWYLFALLALAAPFAMARAELKLRRDDEDESGGGARAGAGELGAAPPEAPVEEERTEAQRRAAKLADRYGRVVR